MSFWKKLAKVGMFAAPIAATIATGGAASPWLATTIGAASGAGSKLIDHPKDWKGALMGAGIGAGSSFAGSKLLGGMKGMGGKTNQMIPGVGDGGRTGAGSLLGGVGSYMKQNPMVPLAAMSLLGGLGGDSGGGGGEGRVPFRGGLTNAEDTLGRSNSALFRLGQGLNEAPPTVLKGITPKYTPGPVQIPGLPFQIGGAMGHDPSMDDLTVETGAQTYDPFQSMPQQESKLLGAPPKKVR